jgi:hypothetical protein
MESLLILMLCAFVVVVSALVALLVILLKPKKNQTENVRNASTGNIRRPHKDWKSWILFFVISLFIAIWTIWGALFFLATVWIMRMDPKPYQKEIPYPSDLDRDSAKGIYTWLLLSPFLTVPTMIIAALNLDWNSSPNEWVFAALIPLVFHLPMLFKLNTKSVFVYRHTQQAIFLVALRAGMASIALSIGEYPGEGVWLFFLGNGVLWLFGSLWARGQAVRRECWWMKRKGETILPLEAQIIDKPVTNDESKEQLNALNTEGNTAKQKALNTFRAGTSDERKQAVLVLSQLGEVEKF